MFREGIIDNRVVKTEGMTQIIVFYFDFLVKLIETLDKFVGVAPLEVPFASFAVDFFGSQLFREPFPREIRVFFEIFLENSLQISRFLGFFFEIGLGNRFPVRNPFDVRQKCAFFLRFSFEKRALDGSGQTFAPVFVEIIDFFKDFHRVVVLHEVEESVFLDVKHGSFRRNAHGFGLSSRFHENLLLSEHAVRAQQRDSHALAVVFEGLLDRRQETVGFMKRCALFRQVLVQNYVFGELKYKKFPSFP